MPLLNVHRYPLAIYYYADSNSVDLRWGLRFCNSAKLSGGIDARSLQTTVKRRSGIDLRASKPVPDGALCWQQPCEQHIGR